MNTYTQHPNSGLIAPGSNRLLRYLIPLLFICAVMINNRAHGQRVKLKTTNEAETIPNYNIEEFTGRCVNGTLYFKFVILENREDIFAYVLEQSYDGSNFSSYALKEGFTSPNNLPLLYCYNKPKEPLYKTYYRVKMVTENGVSYSQTIAHDPSTNSPSLYSQRN